MYGMIDKKYSVNQKVGSIEIYNYYPRTGSYFLRCECGKEWKAGAAYLKRKELVLVKYGFCGCKECFNFKKRKQIESTETLNYKPVITYFKHQASRRKKEITLTDTEIIKLFQSECFYCGETNSNKRPTSGMKNNRIVSHNGIDRLNNDLGYTKENSVSCCKLCNYCKHSLNYNEFINRITKIYIKNVQRPEGYLVASSEAK